MRYCGPAEFQYNLLKSSLYEKSNMMSHVASSDSCCDTASLRQRQKETPTAPSPSPVLYHRFQNSHICVSCACKKAEMPLENMRRPTRLSSRSARAPALNLSSLGRALLLLLL